MAEVESGRRQGGSGEVCEAYGYTPDQYRRFKRGAWVYLIMFSLVYMCLYCTRLNLSYAAPP